MKRAGRRLSREEKHLWERVTRTVKPRSKPTFDMSALLDGHVEPAVAAHGETSVSAKKSSPSIQRSEPTLHQDTRDAVKTHALSGRATEPDRKTLRRLRRRGVAASARIDLHGMTRDRAFKALDAFFAARRREGVRQVLVITGKGRAASSENDHFSAFDRPGVLRRAAPEWFTGPLAHHVASFDTAGPRFGADGAFFVVLRRIDTEG